jgi:glycosyltransferase involved in cell wall biosynthesis
MKKVLIIVCAYNSKNYTEKLYNDLKDVENIDLLIVDNSSSEEHISNFPPYIHIGYENVEYGGMHDFILNMDSIYDYDFVGIFSNDIFGFSNKHFETLQRYLADDVGYCSFSISPLYDVCAGVMHPVTSTCREVSFIENVAPIYNVKLLKELQKVRPTHKFGLIDVYMSIKSQEMGMKNIIIDEVSFHHIRSGVRKQVNSFENYIGGYVAAHNDWVRAHPDMINYLCSPENIPAQLHRNMTARQILSVS